MHISMRGSQSASGDKNKQTYTLLDDPAETGVTEAAAAAVINKGRKTITQQVLFLCSTKNAIVWVGCAVAIGASLQLNICALFVLQQRSSLLLVSSSSSSS